MEQRQNLYYLTTKTNGLILIEPTYQSFKSQKTTDVNPIYVTGGKLITTVDYNSIEMPLSVRHYFFLTANSKIFITTSFIFDYIPKSTIEFKRADNSLLNTLNSNPLEIDKFRYNFALGFGYKFMDKYIIEMRYQTNRQILENYASWDSQYKTISIIFGYTLFKK